MVISDHDPAGLTCLKYQPINCSYHLGSV